jgi:hypothetical protein
MQIQFNASDMPHPLSFPLQDVLIDTATPFVWLPPTAYDSLREAMDLRSNTTFVTNFLPITNADSNRWQSHHATINFIIPNSFSSSQAPSVISADPADWWKKVTPPFTDTGSRAKTVPIAMLPDNQTTPVLGLAFFTYACMLANYDDEMFAIIPQSLRYDGATKIKSVTNGYTQPPMKSKSNSKILAIGISLAVLVLFLTIGLLGCLFRRRRTNNRRLIEEKAQVSPISVHGKVELGGPALAEPDIAEKDGTKLVEAGGSGLSEMDTPAPPVELDGQEVRKSLKAKFKS